MSENVIFCYSGTGNCLDMAKNIARELGDTDIVMMRSAPAVTDVRTAKRVGFIFPCYAGGLPGDVEKYVRQIQVGPMAYTFGVCQYAGYMGAGLHQLDGIIRLNYWRAVSHQCSCIWLFPHHMMLPPMPAKQAQKRSEKKAREIAAAVLAGERSKKHPPVMAVNALESKAWPVLSKQKAKKFAVSGACIGCGQCARLCPKGNIRMEGGKPVIGTDCIQCLSCLQYCPKGAISVGNVTDKREHYHNPNVRAGELTEPIIHID